MTPYVLRRLGLSLISLLLLSVLCFSLVQFVPGGPVEHYLHRWSFDSLQVGGAFQDPDDLRSMLEHHFEFDRPLVPRYRDWLFKFVQGDWGQSYYHAAHVTEMIREALPASLWLALLAFVSTYVLAIVLGTTQALWSDSKWDQVSQILLVSLYAIPTFAFAAFLAFALGAGWITDYFPLQGLGSAETSQRGLRDLLWHSFLPTLCYVAGALPPLAALTRDSLLYELSEPFATAARARGVNEVRLVLRHALPGAGLVLVHGFGGWLALIVSGSVVIETIFGIPGMGRLGYEAAVQRDFPLLIALVMCIGGLQVTGGLVSDLLHHWMDPRVHFA